jgi:hypothetical protein
VLSVISAIFLLLTLLTGIFGMNFQHMPGLAWSSTYAALIPVMIATVGGMLSYFEEDGLGMTEIMGGWMPVWPRLVRAGRGSFPRL